MLIPKDILAKLACPVCRKPLHAAPDDSAYKCEGCGRVYPVRDGIPVFLTEEGVIKSE